MESVTDKIVVTTDGHAPHVPKHESPLLADTYTLILMVRETLQNGVNPTRGNLAFAELVKRMAIPAPKLDLDPLPYVKPNGDRSEFAKGNYEDLVEYDDDGNETRRVSGGPWGGEFAPRYNYSQDKSEYNPGPGAAGWYDDPDGSGQERYWLGMMWADLYRKKGAK